MTFPDRAQFLATYRPNQNWSLPDTMIYYMVKNPSSTKGYQKMAQACKYFFVQNPIIVAEKLRWCFMACLKNERKRIKFTRIPCSKLWITDVLHTNDIEKKQSHVSSVIPRIYRCDAKTLFLADQIISYNEFFFLIGSVEDINFCSTVVKDENGGIIPLEKFVAALPPAVNKIELAGSIESQYPTMFTKNTVKEFLKIPHFPKIGHLTLYCIPESFDIDTFFEYMKKNKYTKFYLGFGNSLSEAYQARLNAFIDGILETENHEYKIPFIGFADLDNDKRMKLQNLSSQ